MIYQIVVNPEIQSQLQEEIDDIFEGKEEGEDLSADDLTNMPYLDKVNPTFYVRVRSIHFFSILGVQ